MEELKFNVYKNCLTIIDPFKPHIHPAADTVRYLKGTFTFDSTWDGFEKRVYFKNSSYNIVKSVLLGDSNICYVPWEVLAHTGVIRCNIIGLKYSDDIVTQRITTNPVVFEILVDESILEPYDQQPLTPTEYEQFRVIFEGLYTSTVEARDDAIEAKEDAEQISTDASAFVEQAKSYKEDSEAYAIGKRSGEPVEEDDPTYENNASYYAYQASLYFESAVHAKDDAEDARDDAIASKLDAAASANTSLLFSYDSEAYAVGKRNGQDVESSDITYHNNAKYYNEDARDFSLVSEGFSVGEQNGQPVSSDSPYYENNAKYFYEHMNNGVFVAIYGVTSYDDIYEAYSACKMIYLRTINAAGYYHYYPTDVTDIGTLVLRYADGRKLYTVRVLPSDMWSSSYVESQEKLVSGTNIKTINNTSLLGSGNIDIQSGGNVFIVELGETTYQEVVDAADDGATVLLSVEIIATGEKQYYSLVQIYNHRCVFACQRGAEVYFYLLNDNNSWDSQTFRAQEALVSGTNIKTINNTSLLGSGNITVGGDSNVQSDWNQADSTADDYIKNKPTIPSKTSDLNNDSGFLSGSGILDMFYPVGSYYETSDVTFDPNVSWGGTWELEIAGQVHVSAHPALTIGEGTYHINGALTNASDGGESTHKLKSLESGQRSLSITGGAHSHTITSYFSESVSYGSGSASRPYTGGNKTTTGWNSIDNNTGTHTHSVSAADATDAHNNMQPYVVVNRWHRTA